MFARFSIVLIAVFAMASTSAAACSGALVSEASPLTLNYVDSLRPDSSMLHRSGRACK